MKLCSQRLIRTLCLLSMTFMLLLQCVGCATQRDIKGLESQAELRDIALKKEISETNLQITDRLASLSGATAADSERIRGEVTYLKTRIGELDAIRKDVLVLRGDVSGLARDAERDKGIYERLSQRLNEIDARYKKYETRLLN